MSQQHDAGSSRKASLNPCSVETIPCPIELTHASQAWPCIVSCYELIETDKKRVGRMDISFVQVPASSSVNDLQFPEHSYTLMDPTTCSGILDGEWLQLPATKQQDNTASVHYFATAHASGTIQVHQFQFLREMSTKDPSAPPFHHAVVGESSVPRLEEEDNDDAPPPLCLSVRWNTTTPDMSTPQLVSTYSNGRVAVHTVVLEDNDDNHNFASVSIQLEHVWLAHTLFGTTPAEVWSACFAKNNSVVFSGGDDQKLKMWDLRSLHRPVQCWADGVFEAGVTCITPPAPQAEHVVAVGSYDEKVSLFDVRFMNQEKPLLQTDPLGGGIWRIKWHPTRPYRALVAAMHGGCRVVDFEGFAQGESISYGYKCLREFTEHKSMAYGADWLVSSNLDQKCEAAISCSFYDRAVFLWDTT